jgi:hypothetical protein
MERKGAAKSKRERQAQPISRAAAALEDERRHARSSPHPKP